MAPIDLNLVRAFAAVHQTHSFSDAATRLGVPRSTVSRSVAALETALGVRLFQRTTRKVSTSTAGVALYERLSPSLQQLESALADLPEREEQPSGTLRVTSTVDLGAAVLAETTARFITRYPDTRVEMHLTNDLVDLVRDGFDLALRITNGALRSSSLVMQRVGSLSIRLYASSGYLARRGEPKSVKELPAHDFINVTGARFKLPHLVERVAVNDMYSVREVLKSGGGIGPLPSFLGQAEVTAGTLVPVLPKWFALTGAVSVVQPSRKNQPRKVVAYRELLVETLKRRPL